MTEKDLHKIFSTNIRKNRKTLGLSQVQLANKTGVSVNFINDLESGKKWASPATMLKLAGVFKVEAYELLKPPGLMPDNVGSILKKYADDIHAAVDEARLTILKT
jgi:transcriptional regulator with XRE-family HTH domain